MATNTINDLYLKYTNKVGRTLENDRYFQYLYEMVQAGSNEFQQQHQIMHKVVDEVWLTTIEESLDAINTIIEKPRRFVTTKEEVVPVALAKKISADSVRHLSMNTQFIASSEEGDIQPTRVLNVSTEESYDLYENRFIYHLIQRLVTFIDKRTDVIFWSTGDETQNVLRYESKVDDAYEEISYKIEMTVKNRQSFAENDTDNMSLFMRIDRVRRMVMTLKNSAFCSLMAGCAKVRSPIQRTNLIMKDPYYRTCYKLWQFLENYDDVGYTIEVQNSTLEFDEEYMIQMYINLITNYTVFKTLTESDKRDLQEVLGQKRRTIKPKFIKKIKEEIVDDYNIEDVEVRQVIIEEVTQAQLDAEAKLEEETKARQEAQEALEEMDSQMVFLQSQVSNLMMMNQEAEVKAEDERQAREAAEGQLAQLEADAIMEIEEIKTTAAAELEAVKTNAENEIAALKAAMEEANRKLAELQERAETAESSLAAKDAQMASRIAEVEADAKQRIEDAQIDAKEQIALAEHTANENMEKLRQQTREVVDDVKAQAESDIAAIKQEKATVEANAKKTQDELNAQIKRTQDSLNERTNQYNTSLNEKASLEKQLADANEAWEDMGRRLADAEKETEEARAQAQAAKERAEANTLSHYIISALKKDK